MIVRSIDEMPTGWFVGNFEPSVHSDPHFEVAYKKHRAGESHETHYHAIAREINLLIRGRMTVQGVTLEAGSIFILEPMEIADPIFNEDCELIVIKTPSVKNDKYVVDAH